MYSYKSKPFLLNCCSHTESARYVILCDGSAWRHSLLYYERLTKWLIFILVSIL